MSEPYIGEIRLISFNFAPSGWALCNGQLLPVNQNQALYAVLGVQYGGDGVTTFALPNLRGRMPIHQGRGFSVGNSGGEAQHTLTLNEMPAHNHALRAHVATTSPGTSPAGALPAGGRSNTFTGAPTTPMGQDAIGYNGGGQPHENRAPYLVLNYVISLQGLYPSRP